LKDCRSDAIVVIWASPYCIKIVFLSSLDSIDLRQLGAPSLQWQQAKTWVGLCFTPKIANGTLNFLFVLALAAIFGDKFTQRDECRQAELGLFGGRSAVNVRFGSKADIATVQLNVRFTPKSRHWNPAA
jgi:hypothetical protein